MPIRFPRPLGRGIFVAAAAALTIGVPSAAAGTVSNNAAVPVSPVVSPVSTPIVTSPPITTNPVTTTPAAGLTTGTSKPLSSIVPAPSTVPTVTSTPVHIAFLGDSYTYGVGASVHTNSYAFDLAREEDWTAEIVGLPGSGYTRVAEKTHEDIAAGIPTIIASQPQVLVVECGHNDSDNNISISATKRNALKDLRRLRAALPNTKIVVVGPIWLSGHPDNHALEARAAIHGVQKRIPHTLWIDPIAEKWFTGEFAHRSGDDASMINYHVAHPNDLGYQHIAQVLGADLNRLGIH